MECKQPCHASSLYTALAQHHLAFTWTNSLEDKGGNPICAWPSTVITINEKLCLT